MGGRVLDRLYGLLLRSFPPLHRSRYGTEMLDAFQRERIVIAEESGLWSALRFVIASYWDALAAGLAERRDASPMTNRHRPEGLFFGIGKDVRAAAWNLTRSWTFTLVCLTSLAIGLGINLAISSLLLVNLASPPGIREEGALEVLLMTRGLTLGERWTFPDFEDVRKSNTGMDVTGWVTGARSLRTDDGADDERVSAMYVSANYFTTLGMTITRGRPFLPEEDDAVGEPPVVVSFDMWENRLGSDPDVVGRNVTLNRTVHTVIGVAPPGFVGHFAGQRADVWIPLWEHPRLTPGSDFRIDRSLGWLGMLGRLDTGTTAIQVNGALAGVMTDLAEAHPETNQLRSARTVRYAKQGQGEEDWKIPKAFLLAVRIMALVIVCLNISGMVLVRGASRARELAVRLALGSSRTRLVRYLMAESGLLAMAGGLLSLTVGWAALQVMAWKIGQPLPDGLITTLAGQAMGWSFAMMFLIGLSPAIQSSRSKILRALKDDAGGGRRLSGRIHRRATSLQAFVAVLMIVLTSIVIQSTRMMDHEDYGFQPDGLIVSRLDLTAGGYTDEEVETFMLRLQATTAALPGVESVSIADAIPLDFRDRDQRVSTNGEAGTWVAAQSSRATAGYFETIGTPILQGRGIEDGDVAGAQEVAVITESLSRRLWPSEGGLGQRITTSFRRPFNTELTVVGIVADVVGSRHGTEPQNLFVSQWQHPTNRINLVLRSSLDVGGIRTAIQDAALALDPDLTRPLVVTSRTLTDQGKDDVYFISAFLGGISSLMLLLVALGVYGVVGFSVANRTREFGIRMAMGASRRRVLALVLLDGLKLALPGIAGGSLLALVLSQYVLVLVYDYFGHTALVGGVLAFAIVAALTVVLVASSIPAQRATGVRPMEALRAE